MSNVITSQPQRPNIEDEEAIHPTLVTKSRENLKNIKSETEKSSCNIGCILCAIITCPCKCCEECCDLCADICAEDQRRRAYYNRNESISVHTFPDTDNNMSFFDFSKHTNKCITTRIEDTPVNTDLGCIGFESFGEPSSPNQCNVDSAGYTCNADSTGYTCNEDSAGYTCDANGDVCDTCTDN